MMKIGRAGSTFGTVVAAAVVLAIAASSGAVAGSLITSKQIKNNTIKSIDVRDGNLKGVDVADGSLTRADIANGAITASKLGPVVERSSTVAVSAGASNTAQVACLAGERLLSGGMTTTFGNPNEWFVRRSDKVGANGWETTAYNASGSPANLTAKAYCLQ